MTVDELASLIKSDAIRERAELANEWLLELGSEERRLLSPGEILGTSRSPGAILRSSEPSTAQTHGNGAMGTVSFGESQEQEKTKEVFVTAVSPGGREEPPGVPKLDSEEQRGAVNGAVGLLGRNAKTQPNPGLGSARCSSEFSSPIHRRKEVLSVLRHLTSVRVCGAESPSVGEQGVGRLRPSSLDERGLDAAGGILLGFILGGLCWVAILGTAWSIWRALQ